MHDVFSSENDPEPRDAANRLLNALERGDVVTLQGYCIVDYEGRAKSEKPAEGYFVTLLKPDGTALVHSNEKYKPMNWQPSGAEISPEITESGNLMVKAESDEYLSVEYVELYLISTLSAAPRSELDLVGTEEDMHNRIMSNPELVSDAFEAVENERKFPFGRVDVYGEENGAPVIVEVKRRSITRDHIYQLYTYIMEYEEEFGETPEGILVAPSCSEYMQELMEKYDLRFSEVDPLS